MSVFSKHPAVVQKWGSRSTNHIPKSPTKNVKKSKALNSSSSFMKFTFSMGATIEKERATANSQYRWKSKLDDKNSIRKDLDYDSAVKYSQHKPYRGLHKSYKSRPRYNLTNSNCIQQNSNLVSSKIQNKLKMNIENKLKHK